MHTRQILLAILAVLISGGELVEAGGHHCRRYAPVSYGRLDYAPYTYVRTPSLHGPAMYYGTGHPIPYVAPYYGHRSYYTPMNYGYARPYGLGVYGARPSYRYGYGYRGYHFTRYGIYGGSYGYAPVRVGYPYATGYLSAVRPVQPYMHSYQVGAIAPAYTPCVYGAYGLGASY